MKRMKKKHAAVILCLTLLLQMTAMMSVSNAAGLSSEKEIISFELKGQISSKIVGTSITVIMPFGTNLELDSLLPTIEVSEDAGVEPISGHERIFDVPLVKYTVTAQDGSEAAYYVTVIAENGITAFTIPNQVGDTVFNGSDLSVTMPFGTDVTSLAPNITVAAGASVSPESGGVQDFTNPVTYTVTAQNGFEQDYTVTVVLAEGPSGSGNVYYGSEPEPAPRSNYEKAIVVNVKEWANVRSGPGIDTEIAGRVYLGEQIELLQWNKDETWCKVLYNDGNNLGWLHYKFIKPVQ